MKRPLCVAHVEILLVELGAAALGVCLAGGREASAAGPHPVDMATCAY